MPPANQAFIQQILTALGENAIIIGHISAGQRYCRDGLDVTAEILADAQRRWRDADAIIRAYA